MSLADTAFMVGPLGAVVLVPLSMVAIAVGRRPRWLLVLGAGLTAGVGVAWLAYWVLWGRSFDYVDAGRQVPAGLDTATDLAMSLCAAGVVVLGAGALTSLASSRRTKPPHRS